MKFLFNTYALEQLLPPPFASSAYLRPQENGKATPHVTPSSPGTVVETTECMSKARTKRRFDVIMTGSIVGKRFYQKVTTREADYRIGCSVMLDYRTLKTPSKRNLKCPTLALGKAIAAEWEGVPELQVVKFGPLIKLVESEFGFKPFLYTSFFGGNQEEGLVNVIENFLKKTDHYVLAAIDATAHSLITAIGVFRGRLSIEQAIELIRLEEDSHVDRWGLVEGGHDVDIADLKSPNLIRWCLSQTFKACCLNYNQLEYV